MQFEGEIYRQMIDSYSRYFAIFVTIAVCLSFLDGKEYMALNFIGFLFISIMFAFAIEIDKNDPRDSVLYRLVYRSYFLSKNIISAIGIIVIIFYMLSTYYFILNEIESRAIIVVIAILGWCALSFSLVFLSAANQR